MKKIVKLTLIILVLVSMLFVLSGCGKEEEPKYTSKPKTNTTSTSTNTVTEDKGKINVVNEDYDYLTAANKQMALPEKGEQIAVMHIKNYGDIYIKFFPDVAPKAVENFITHSKDGYYNGVTFHRVMEEFMIQGGDPEGTGRGGESIWGQDFEEEIADSIKPYRGALCMASRGSKNSPSLGSQFYIVQAHYSATGAAMLRQYGASESMVEAFTKFGGDLGNLYFYDYYTVFGQVYDGMDVVDKIAKETKVEDSNGTVLKENQPIIESIEIKEY